MQNINNIIFDLGGIFIDIDFRATKEAFKSLGITNFDDFFTQHTASSLFEQLETGKVSPETFYEEFRKETNAHFSNEQIRDAWNAMLGHFPTERLRWLEEIKKKYKVYLYSNTNLIHYIAFQQIYRECTGKNNFDDYFIKAYYSHELGLRKPYPEGFIRICQLEGLIPGETLFIDDTPKNVEGAKEAGLQGIYLPHPKTVFDLGL